MVDWMSPAEIAKDAASFNNLMHVLLGVYIWEWAISLDFDWSVVSGKRRFRWPLIFYFLNRYCLFFAMIGIAIALNVKSELNCQALYTFNQLVGNASIGLASINLSIRTMAVWQQRWYIVAPLVAIILGQWSLLLHGVLLSASFVPGQGCVITHTDARTLAASFIYTMSLDLLVLALTAYKLAFPAGGRSRLVTMIFGDGLIYFVIAFLSNLTATVFMTLNLNPVMSIIANVPSAIASTIVACRAVRRLTIFFTQEPERFITSDGTAVFRSPRSGQRSGTGSSTRFGVGSLLSMGKKDVDAEGVSVNVPPHAHARADKDTYTYRAQLSTFSAARARDDPPGDLVHYDAAGRVLKIGPGREHEHDIDADAEVYGDADLDADKVARVDLDVARDADDADVERQMTRPRESGRGRGRGGGVSPGAEAISREFKRPPY